jgi:hypothetical protein
MPRQVFYGLLVNYTKNLGDDIQSLAAAQFLPRTDFFIDRDDPRLPRSIRRELEGNAHVKVIMNGWYTLNPLSWMPDPLLKPLIISFHVHPPIANIFLGRHNVSAYLKYFEPVGARDIHTKKLLIKHNIKSYFSGCLSITLNYKYKFYEHEKYKYILVSDLDKNIVYLVESISPRIEVISISPNLFISTGELILPKSTKRKIKRILGETLYSLADNIMFDFFDAHKARVINPINRLRLVEKYIALIAQSKLVITSRLHTALPALSFGIPVIFINDNLKDPRFTGYMQFFYAFTPEEFVREVKKNPNLLLIEQIPNEELLNELKEKLKYMVKSFI